MSDTAVQKHPYVLEVLTAVRKQWDTSGNMNMFVEYIKSNIGTLQNAKGFMKNTRDAKNMKQTYITDILKNNWGSNLVQQQQQQELKK